MIEERGENVEQTMGIGALSRATGIPVETIRTWERRYGFPDPERNAAGHRVYPLSMVEHMNFVDRALNQGYRPSNVLGLSIDELRELPGVAEEAVELRPGGQVEFEVDDGEYPAVRRWLEAVSRYDAEAFEGELRNSWHELGALRFVEERVRPFLVGLGRAWAERRVEVAHEHFASERLRDFLTSQWRPLSDRSRGPRVVCTTMPGEDHCLGLQMAALILAIAGCRIIFLGSDTPVSDVANAASGHTTAAVVISISVAANRFMARRDLATLRESLPDEVDLIVGGQGAVEGLEDVRVVRSFESLLEYGRKLSSEPG